MKQQYRIVRREKYRGNYEYGIARIPQASWDGPAHMVVEFRSFGDDNPIGSLRQIVADLQSALKQPVVDFKDL